MKYLIMLFACMVPLVAVANIEIRPSVGEGVVITDADGNVVHFQTLESGEIMIPGMADVLEDADGVLLCYNPVSGQLRNCPDSIVDSAAQQTQIDVLNAQLLALQAMVDALNPCTSARRVFLTSSFHNGDLGGLTGADQRCNQAASDAGIPGSFMAWLSTSSASPASRFVHSSVPYCLVDNVTVVAADWAQLVSGSLSHPINMTELGTSASTLAWTGTNASGNGMGVHCADWTTSSGVVTGRTGSTSDSGALWTDSGGNWTCDTAVFRLYCFQQ